MLTSVFKFCTSKCRVFLPSACFEFWDVGWVMGSPHIYQYWSAHVSFIILMCIQDTIGMYRACNRCSWCPAPIPFNYPCSLAVGVDAFQSMESFPPQHLLLFFSASGLSWHPEDLAKPQTGSAQKCGGHQHPWGGGPFSTNRRWKLMSKCFSLPSRMIQSKTDSVLHDLTWPTLRTSASLNFAPSSPHWCPDCDSEASFSQFPRGFPAGPSPSIL